MNVIGIIYRIDCLKTNRSYVGHTTKTLEERMKKHESIDNMCTSWIIISECNYKESVIVEITEYEYETQNNGMDKHLYLLSQEQLYMDTIPNLVNKNKALLTPEEKLVYNQNWRKNNKDKCWHYDNDGYDCPCGGRIRKNAPLTHLGSMRHRNYIKDFNNEITMYNFLKENKWGTRENKVVSVRFPVVELPVFCHFDLKKNYNVDEIRLQLLHSYVKRVIRYDNGYKLMSGKKSYF